MTVEAAFDIVENSMDQPVARIAIPGPRHLAIMRSLLERVGTGGNLTSDAHLAAIAIEHNGLLCSCDNDFARFSGLRWQNPLS